MTKKKKKKKERKKITSREKVFNQHGSQTDGYDSNFDSESPSVKSLNFDKVQKNYNQCEIGSSLHGKMADIISSNFSSRIYKTTSREKEKIFLLSSNCSFSVPWVNSELRRITPSNQRKGEVKLATLKTSFVAGALNIFTEVQKENFETQTTAQWYWYK